MMKAAKIRSILVFAAAAVVASCNGLDLDTAWRRERYVLIAVDVPEQMNLAFDVGQGTAAGLVGPTVFAIGADEKYIVVKQHPCKDPAGSLVDRSITNYFIVTRTLSPQLADRKKGVRGPLTEAEYQKEAKALSLPRFSKAFDDLQ